MKSFKLYPDITEKEIEEGGFTRNGEPIAFEQLFSAEIETKTALESVTKTITLIGMVNESLNYLNNTPSSTTLYIERYGKTLGLLSKDGVIYRLPSLESYDNPFALEQTHAIAMEGLKEVVADLWDKLKTFLKNLWKALVKQVKIMFDLELDLDAYDGILKKRVREIKDKASSVRKIPTRLPSYFSQGGRDYSLNTYLRDGVETMEHLGYLTLEEIPRRLSNLTEAIYSIESGISAKPSAVVHDEVINALSILFTEEAPYEKGVRELTGIDLSRDFTYRSLISLTDPYKKLPRGFNIFFGYKDISDITSINTRSSIVFMEVKSERETNPINSMDSISSANTFKQVYATCKDSIGKVDIAKFNKLLDKTDAACARLIQTMERINRTMPDRGSVKKLGSLTKSEIRYILESNDVYINSFMDDREIYNNLVSIIERSGVPYQLINDELEVYTDTGLPVPSKDTVRERVIRDRLVLDAVSNIASGISYLSTGLLKMTVEIKFHTLKYLYESSRTF